MNRIINIFRYDDPEEKNFTFKKILTIKTLKDFLHFLMYLPHGSPS